MACGMVDPMATRMVAAMVDKMAGRSVEATETTRAATLACTTVGSLDTERAVEMDDERVVRTEAVTAVGMVCRMAGK